MLDNVHFLADSCDFVRKFYNANTFEKSVANYSATDQLKQPIQFLNSLLCKQIMVLLLLPIFVYFDIECIAAEKPIYCLWYSNRKSKTVYNCFVRCALHSMRSICILSKQIIPTANERDCLNCFEIFRPQHVRISENNWFKSEFCILRILHNW